MKERCEKEIVDLHQFFQAWLGGQIPATDQNFRRFISAISDDFAIIGPDGSLTTGDVLQQMLRDGNGSRQDFKIWIENYRFHHHKGDVAVVTYEEWQTMGGDGSNARQSTAIFQEDANAPNGVIWLHVHESWLPRQKAKA